MGAGPGLTPFTGCMTIEVSRYPQEGGGRMIQERSTIAVDAAEIYEERFVPAIFIQWPDRVLDAAGVGPGHRVLDVACGTGVLARAAVRRVGPTGSVAGLDINPAMLAVAKRIAPDITWWEAPAEGIPDDDASYDAVVSQFGLMFFTDRAAALQHMSRVRKPGGRLAVAVWDSLDNSPGFAALVGLLQRVVGTPAADALRAPFSLGDRDTLAKVFEEAGLTPAITTHEDTARFPSLDGWLHTNVLGWPPLRAQVNDDQCEALRVAMPEALGRFVTREGRVEFPISAHIVAAQ